MYSFDDLPSSKNKNDKHENYKLVQIFLIRYYSSNNNNILLNILYKNWNTSLIVRLLELSYII